MKKCKRCKKEFKTKANRQAYCSKKCFKEQRKEDNKNYSREWRKTNTFDRSYRKERDKELHKKYYQKNKKRLSKLNKKSYDKWRKENPQKVLNYARKWREKNSKKMKGYAIKYRKIHQELVKAKRKIYILKNKEKILAQQLSANIKIPKGQICMRCNKKLAKAKHHKDYSKPYDVDFVCNSCHTYIHLENEKIEVCN